ncbi:MAG: radical SAM protein [Candidatus Omnitrophica bacterium]|nr:radical SAM protein [Candidatus Omnitrophota bacterium]
MTFFQKMVYGLSRYLGRPLLPPQMMILSLTNQCNLQCGICSIKQPVDAPRGAVDVAKIFDIIDQACQMKISQVVLSGGEPFLVKEIFEISDYIKKRNMDVSVTTNGYYNREMIERIAASSIDHVHFSFDGNKDAHDRLRGAGAYDRLLQNIVLLRKLNPVKSIGVGTVIYRNNCGQLYEMTNTADRLGVNVMNFIPYLVRNTDPQNSPKGVQASDLWPQEDDVMRLKDDFKMILTHEYQNLRIDWNPDAGLLEDYYSLKSIHKKCAAGYKSMIITAGEKRNGRMSSCVFFCQDSCGDVYRMGIRQAWYSSKAGQMRRKAQKCKNPCLQFCHYF